MIWHFGNNLDVGKEVLVLKGDDSYYTIKAKAPEKKKKR
jgi:hypothetical protein